MTLENYNYRTNPMFLRNQFYSNNDYGIPSIPLCNYSSDELTDLKLLAFNQLNRDNGKHTERIIHFFYMIITLKRFGKTLMNKLSFCQNTKVF